MYTLDPIYSNSFGSAFTIRNDDEVHVKIQVLIGDIAILMEMHEIKTFLKVIKSAYEGCTSPNCNCKNACKTIKCDTAVAAIYFKLSTEKLKALEELVLGILFHIEYDAILSFNEIYK